MKLGLVMTIFNRPEYLAQTLASLKNSNFPANIEIFIYDDASTDKTTHELFINLKIPGIKINKYRSDRNRGMFFGLEYCYEEAIAHGCTLLINLDSDAIVKPDWLALELALLNIFPNAIITGFNTLVQQRHPILKTTNTWYLKRSIGGINMLFSVQTYKAVVKSALKAGLRWDWNVCERMHRNNQCFYCTRPSVVQHIGIDSTVKHINADIAVDF